jgi:ATP-dependent exoDNAse (exonuclease V) beta subunit
VVLPGLGRKGRSASHELMRWRSRDRGLLIAPSRSPGGDDDPVYAYLTKLDRDESSAELGRLLYVACTRAQSRLHLVAAPGAKEGADGTVEWRPPGTSSLAKLWPVLSARATPAMLAPPSLGDGSAAQPLLRVPAGFATTPPDDVLPVPDAATNGEARDVPFDWAQERARVIGTLAHRLLARVATPDTWDESRIAALLPRVRADLASAGFADGEIVEAERRVLDAVRNTLSDARGRWLFDPRHDDARSEWGIAGVDEGAIVHLVVDRTFVADGVRWIVDFKTGTHEGGDADGFLASEAERYRPQLQRYGRLMRALDARPVRLALYYPLVPGGFREIPPG